MNQKVKAHIGLLCTNLFFAANYTAVKYFTGNHISGPFGLNVIRIGGSLILFWLLFLFSPHKQRVEKKEIFKIAICALTAIALNQMLFIKGLSLTFSIHAALLTLITPIMITVIAAVILKEKITALKIIGLFLGISGAILLIKEKVIVSAGDNIVLGDFLILLSAVAYTIYFIIVKPLMKKYDSIKVMQMVFTFGFFMILPLCVKEFSEIKWQVFEFKEWLLLFIITVPGTFLAYIFNAYGIQKLNASIAGAYIYSQPVFAVAIAMIFLKEELSFYKILAAILIFAGVFLSGKHVQHSETTEVKL